MSHVLTVELSDAAYTVLERHAQATATSPVELAVAALEQRFGASDELRKLGRPTNQAGQRAARERFERHFGAANVGYATGADNETIDADWPRLRRGWWRRLMLLDTSGLLCLLHQPEPFHQEACQAYRATVAKLTHSYVLAEFIALAQARRIPRPAALEFVTDLVANSDIEMVWVNEVLHGKAMTLLRTRLDKTYSLCDAVSFVLMREWGVREGLTTDRHFEQEGFRKLLG